MEQFNQDSLLEIDVLYTESAPVDEVVASVQRLLRARHGGDDVTIATCIQWAGIGRTVGLSGQQNMNRTLLLSAVLLCAACRTDDVDRTPPMAPSADAPQAGSEPATDAPPLAMLPRTYAPEGARVFIVSPADGAEVTSPVRVEFGAENVAIVPAGDQTPNSGHHHLIVDAGLPVERFPIPANDNYIHFGDGLTSTG